MKAAIYNPYLDTLGGGERYTLSFAKVLSDYGYEVYLQWSDPGIKQKLEKRFGMNLKKINIIPDIKKGDGYDICFWVSDGSIPLIHARRNILHFQVPFNNVKGRSLINKMKLIRINKIVCNSKFTKEVIDKEFGVNSLVIYPPVDTNSFRSKRKENIILYVGRFSKILQSKGQEVLISAFRKMCDSGLKDWKLILAGGVEVGVGDYMERLNELSQGLPVEIIESPSFLKLKDLYGRAKIFWSAAGYGQDEMKNPEKMEHFGITAVEAMSGGAVPIIYNGGGHKEIVEEAVSGYLWGTVDELIDKTYKLMTNNKQLHIFENNVHKMVEQFSINEFKNKIDFLDFSK